MLDAPWLSWPEIAILDEAFAAGNFTLRFVGGCVRDTLLGREVTEIDAATDATPPYTMALLQKAGIRALPTGIEHGTVTALIGSRTIEITTLRSDIATDGRHAEVAFTTRWEEDAARRDFTINAIYADRHGKLFDPVGGIADCAARHLRFIGDASARVQEDYLRILRYFRFLAQLEIPEFDEVALAACAQHKGGIAKLSGERIHTELFKLLGADRSYPILRKMAQTGILAAIFATPLQLEALRRLEDIEGGNALLKLAVLLGGEAPLKTVIDRLKLSGRQARQLQTWIDASHLFSPAMDDAAQKKARRAFGAQDYIAALHLAYAHSPAPWEHYAPLLTTAQWEPPVFPVHAQDLLARGFSEGKILGDKLKELEARWEASGYNLTAAALLATLR